MRRSGVRSSSSPPPHDPKQSSKGRFSRILMGKPAFSSAGVQTQFWKSERSWRIQRSPSQDAITTALSDPADRKAKPADKPLRRFGGGDLYLEISPGSSKLWRLKYRFAGKEKRHALGICPDVSLAGAREGRSEARRLLAQEFDPGAYRKVQRTAKADRATNSFEAVAREWLAKYSRAGLHRTRRKSSSGSRTMCCRG